jgi:hypothetical protein
VVLLRAIPHTPVFRDCRSAQALAIAGVDLMPVVWVGVT